MALILNGNSYTTRRYVFSLTAPMFQAPEFPTNAYIYARTQV